MSKFKIGDRVYISPTSCFFSTNMNAEQNANSGNPCYIQGTVTELKNEPDVDLPIVVEWDNARWNSYKYEDLMLVPTRSTISKKFIKDIIKAINPSYVIPVSKLNALTSFDEVTELLQTVWRKNEWNITKVPDGIGMEEYLKYFNIELEQTHCFSY